MKLFRGWNRVAAFVFVAGLGVALVGPIAIAQNYLFGRLPLPTGDGPAGVIIADFNRDGKPDIATTNFNDNTVSIVLGVRNGTFASSVSYATGGITCDLDCGRLQWRRQA
jgi:hypothetical protein